MMVGPRIMAALAALMLLVAGALLVGQPRLGREFWIGFGAATALALALVLVGTMLRSRTAQG